MSVKNKVNYKFKTVYKRDFSYYCHTKVSDPV